MEGNVDSCKEKTRDASDRAETLVDRMRARTGSGCVPYAVKMAVKAGHGLSFVSSTSHPAYKKIDKRKICTWDCSWWSCKRKCISRGRHSISLVNKQIFCGNISFYKNLQTNKCDGNI